MYKRLYCRKLSERESGKARTVLSGGQGKGEEISEAEAMRRYLEKSGIDSRRIFLEDRSVNTKENLQFSMEKIQNFSASVGVGLPKSDSMYFGEFQLEKNWDAGRMHMLIPQKGMQLWS